MNRAEFDRALAAYGGDFARWPGPLADAGRALAATDEGAAGDLAAARQLDALLAARVAPMAVDAATVGRIISGISGDRGHQAAAVRPTGKLFAWTGAAMAVFLVAGFVLGFALPQVDDDDDALASLMLGTAPAAVVDANGGVL
jgi:hypothetical protein